MQTFYCADTSASGGGGGYTVYQSTGTDASMVQSAMEHDTQDSEPQEHVPQSGFNGGTVSSAHSFVVTADRTPNYATRGPVPSCRMYHGFNSQTAGLRHSFRVYLPYRGATAQEAKIWIKETGPAFLQRYHRALCRFLQVAVQRKPVADPSSFQQCEAIPMHSSAQAVASFASEYSSSEAENLYSALTLFPCF